MTYLITDPRGGLLAACRNFDDVYQWAIANPVRVLLGDYRLWSDVTAAVDLSNYVKNHGGMV